MHSLPNISADIGMTKKLYYQSQICVVDMHSKSLVLACQVKEKIDGTEKGVDRLETKSNRRLDRSVSIVVQYLL
jgi:hypothetical protein